MKRLAVSLATIALSLGPPAGLADEPALAGARRLLMTGNYAEAAQAYGDLADVHAVEAAVGQARSQAAQGEYDQARATLAEATEQHADAADLRAELARLAFGRGQHAGALEHAEAALRLDANSLAARWVRAELFRTSGDLPAADKAYEWLVTHYNNVQDEFTSADDLRYIGQAAAQFARWNRLTDQFTFLVNDLHPATLAVEADYWPAHYEAGLLFLEKFNEAEATKALRAAQKINPHSADVHAALARLAIQNYDLTSAQKSIDRSLEINPRHLGAKRMQADVHLANFEPAKAAEVLEEARQLNLVSEATLGRLAAVYGMQDGLQEDLDGTRMGKIVAEVTKRNPHAGEFFHSLASSLDKGRKFPQAARFFAEAVRVMPQRVGPRGQLGLMHMRLGNEAEARRVLEESFDIDPFNIRVSNTLKVLDVLDTYETLETEHFMIRYDGKKDRVLSKVAARYLEEVYPELCTTLGFEPPEKSLFEIFNAAKNTDGHGWFSARMVGLPNVHTIGACAGKMVAITSPTSMRRRVNWARILKHEMVHVINLQQTNFNIPHWYTEALAVWIEGNPRQTEWNDMLARRVPRGQVFDLETINMGFIRPNTSEDWQMAYCQAEIYAEYMVAQHGEESLIKMLSAYRDNLTTAEAIRRSLGVTVQKFEAGYAEYLGGIVAELTPVEKKTPLRFAALKNAHAADPENHDLSSKLALVHLRRKQLPEAGRLADKVLRAEPRHQLATYVQAKLLLSIGKNAEAYKMLEACLDRRSPQAEVVKLLAGLKFKAEQYDEAEALYELGAKHDPANLDWTKSLAMVYLKTGDRQKLSPILAQLADADNDDLTVRKKLAQMAAEAGDHADAAHWANQAIEINVMDSEMHRLLAEALVGQKKHAAAADQYEVVVELLPEAPDVRRAWAEACILVGRPEQARAALEGLLQRNPNDSAARRRLETLDK